MARKYRPKVLQDIIGQDVMVQALSKGLAESRLPQAILLTGIRGTGKTSTARILARAVNCTDPANCCSSCRAMDEDRHPDVLEMDAASHTSVDDIREVIDSVQYRAILGRYKVFIIDEVHMLSKSAFNALLKTLEEPPPHVLFIFATTEINKIPETILSRCARFDLKRVDSNLLIDHFKGIAQKEGYEIEQDALAILARAADGSVRDGLTLLDQAMNLTDAKEETLISSKTLESMTGAADRQRLYEVISLILGRQAEGAVLRVRGIIDDGADPIAVMQDMLECLYRVACIRVVPKIASDVTIPEFERKIAKAIASDVDGMRLLSMWKKMLKGFEDVKKAPYAGQALEMVVLRLCFAASIPSLDEWLNSKGEGDTAMQVNTATQVSMEAVPAIENQGSSLIEQKAEIEESRSIQSIQDLMNALETQREALLLSAVQRDFAFVSFNPGNITVQLKNPDETKAIGLLKQFLYKLTGTRWVIEVDSSSTEIQTFQEQRDESLYQKGQKIMQRPFLQAVQQEFPGAVVDFYHEH